MAPTGSVEWLGVHGYVASSTQILVWVRVTLPLYSAWAVSFGGRAQKLHVRGVESSWQPGRYVALQQGLQPELPK